MTDPLCRLFGTTPLGEPVKLLTLGNGVLSCSILTFGATLQSLHVPNSTGQLVDIVLGYDTLEEYYLHDGYLGASVGRYANRIANSQFTLHGHKYILGSNSGCHHLHGGTRGFSHRVWTIKALTSTQVVLSLTSPDGEEGYPGNLQTQVTYHLNETTLIIHYQAVTDQDTPCNLTNHSYFNLSGHHSGSVLSQKIAIFANQYTPTNSENIPLGTIEKVENTPMDLRQPTYIGKSIDSSFQQLAQAKGYDHNYILDRPMNAFIPTAQAFSPTTGIVMHVETTLPGVQFYTANFLTSRQGKNKVQYGPRHGFCLETQFFPDSPNQPVFPSAILKTAKKYSHLTRFIFSLINQK